MKCQSAWISIVKICFSLTSGSCTTKETTTREQTNKQTKDDSILYHIVEQFFSGSRKLTYVCFSFHFSELDKWVNYLLRLEHSEQICCRKHHTLH